MAKRQAVNSSGKLMGTAVKGKGGRRLGVGCFQPAGAGLSGQPGEGAEIKIEDASLGC